MSLKTVCLSTLVLSLCLIILGPLIQFQPGLPLICQEWPLCFPADLQATPARGWIEIFHRTLATIVGLLTLTLFFQVAKRRTDPLLAKAATYSLFFVFIQGLLGGLTVVYRLPMVVSTLHMFFSMIYIFYLLKSLKRVTAPDLAFKLQPLSTEVSSWWQPKVRDALWISASLNFLTILLSSFVRHTSSLRICGTGVEALWSCSVEWNPLTSQQIILHLGFRVLAFTSFAVSLFTLYHFSKTLKMKVLFETFALPTKLAALTVFFQFMAGLFVIVTHIGLVSSVLYLAFSVLSLFGLWWLALDYSEMQTQFKLQNIHSPFSDLLELTKPRLSALVMVTAMVGVILAPGQIGLLKGFLALILIAMVVMGACALNCYIEMDIDKKMERTRDRSLPAGRMNPKKALWFSVFLLLTSVPLLMLIINPLTGFLALLAAILYLYAYTPMKRRTELALFVGAIPGALPPMMGWTSVTGQLDGMAWVLFAILFVWQLPHFLAISLFHAEDYEHAGIKVYANKKDFHFLKHSIFWYTFALLVTSLLPLQFGELGLDYGLAALCFSATFLGLSGLGYFLDSRPESHRLWARRYFLGSLFYLPLIMGSMIVLR